MVGSPISTETRTPQIFKATFVRPMLSVAVYVFCIDLTVSLSMRPSLSLGVFLAVLAFGTLGAVIPILAVVNYYKVDVDRRGIGGYNPNFYSRIYNRLDWEAIASVRRLPIPGIRYLLVSTSQQNEAILLPLFLADKAGFRAAVAEYAPPENLLRRYLEEHP